MIRMRLLALFAALAVISCAEGALAQSTPAAQSSDQKQTHPAAKPKAKPAAKPAAGSKPAAAKPAAGKPAAAKPAAGKPAAGKPVAAKPVPAKKTTAAPAKKPAAAATVTTKKPAPVAAKPAASAKPAPVAAKPEPAAPKPVPTSTTTASLGSALPSRLGQYGDWNAYTATPNGRKVCFALAKPASSQSDPPNRPRDDAYVFVSSRPGEKVTNEVSIIMGYTVKPSAEASVEIGPAKFAMYTQKDGAWIKNAAEEGRLVDAMRKGPDMVVKGTSGKGTLTTDKFSLKGLAQALDRVAQECR